MVGTVADRVIECRLALTRSWWDVLAGHTRRTEEEWHALLEDASVVQRMVHLASRLVDEDVEKIANRIFDDARIAYRDAIQEELYKWGCHGTHAVIPDRGGELSALRDRADWAANSIVGTYNYELAREIIAIGEATPTANRHVYAYRLFQPDGWDESYWIDKAEEVAQVESMTAINAAIADFYARNDLEPEMAMVEPQAAMCPICQEMVDGNPYENAEDIYRKFIIPAHPGCPHSAATYVADHLSEQQCRDLWVGV